jgi:transcription antitermination factor NusG
MRGDISRDVRWHVIYLSLRGAALVPGSDVDSGRKRSRVEDRLDQKGFITFRPKHKVFRMVRRKSMTSKGRQVRVEREEVERFLFPRYVFVGLRGGLSCWDIRQIDGVEAILCTDHVPCVIKNDDIEDLMAACDMGLFDHGSAFKVGRDVKILGVLEGRTIPQDHTVPVDGKVLTAIKLFGREHVVKVPVDKLQIAS